MTNLLSEPPFRGLKDNVKLQFVGKRVVDFLFAITELFTPVLETLSADIGRNWRFSEGCGSLLAQILGGRGRRPQPLLVSEN